MKDLLTPIFLSSSFFLIAGPPPPESVTEEQPAGPGHITPRQKLERVHWLGQASHSTSGGRLDQQDSIPEFKTRVLRGTERSSRQTVWSSSSMSYPSAAKWASTYFLCFLCQLLSIKWPPVVPSSGVCRRLLEGTGIRALEVLSKDPSSVTSAHIGGLTTTCN